MTNAAAINCIISIFSFNIIKDKLNPNIAEDEKLDISKRREELNFGRNMLMRSLASRNTHNC